ncbi:hypothetical protein PR001_g13710 [Phytophthora rubi]|uniref:Uncharacterized protein n=1 Tax=Phytophthora rubi TaxID=129364 RepID=A0A6A3LPE6_9STRA|nr:hypothetical protein PR001_g13710 [Phytophthora rubi]
MRRWRWLSIRATSRPQQQMIPCGLTSGVLAPRCISSSLVLARGPLCARTSCLRAPPGSGCGTWKTCTPPCATATWV